MVIAIHHHTTLRAEGRSELRAENKSRKTPTAFECYFCFQIAQYTAYLTEHCSSALHTLDAAKIALCVFHPASGTTRSSGARAPPA